MQRKPLGRGLSSLITSPSVEEAGAQILQIPIEEIQPNPQQPRQEWDDETLRELADSIRDYGILQPLIVRARPGGYELVAGERRLRAARQAGLARVPAILKETDEEGSLKLALIENLQREDISPLDSAHAYQQLMERFEMTQEDVARAVGKSRPAVANCLRLLRLPDPILESLRARKITEGHARALLAVDDPAQQQKLWQSAMNGATVREIEAAARPKEAEPIPAPRTELRTMVRRTAGSQPHLEALTERLRRALGVKVEIRGDEHRGMICVEYYSEEDLEHLTGMLLE